MNGCPFCGQPSRYRVEVEHDWHVAIPRVGMLSSRERDVLLLLAAGMSNREIARRLVVTERTVKSHLAQIMEKLGVDSRLRVGLVGFASQLAERA